MQPRGNFTSVDGSLYGNYYGHFNLQSRAAAIFLDFGHSSGHFPNGNLFFGSLFPKIFAPAARENRLRRHFVPAAVGEAPSAPLVFTHNLNAKLNNPP